MIVLWPNSPTRTKKTPKTKHKAKHQQQQNKNVGIRRELFDFLDRKLTRDPLLKCFQHSANCSFIQLGPVNKALVF